jgi:WD40 repeat protein/serine/threonine protein kinase
MGDRDELCGRTIGELVLRERIGEGAFGAVYRCEQPALGREAVIKVLHGQHRARQVMIQRFLREARLASRLDHPYAAHVYAFGVENDGLLWIAMEMVHGTPLNRWLRERGPLVLAELVPFFERIAEVVHTAHEAGIVHRDLKPSNIMVIERAGRLLPKLLDLGIAKLFADQAPAVAPRLPAAAALERTGPPGALAGDGTWTADHAEIADGLAESLTDAGGVVGSPPYMAPEQWDGGAIGPASDLYALGVLAYEALTGRRPFSAATVAELAELHLRALVPPVGPGFAPVLDRFFERALAKQPRDRPASALELAAELRAASGLGEVPVAWVAEASQAPGATAPSPAELPCPYPGMRAYSADKASHFHGREAEVADLLGRLRAGERELYVIGPSGSGKSSLVAAGVLPRLARGSTPGLGPFVVRSLRPGEHPAARLAEALEGELAAPARAVEALLARDAPSAAILLVVDQLEELFTLASGDERSTFLAALRTLRAESRCVLLFTLRADFYGAFMESPLWADLGGRISRIEVAPLRGAALRAAIERPARDLGVSFEPELVERLLADAASEPGILPLLQETMIQLWDRRRLRLLTLADYQALGDGARSGLAVAISRRADASLRSLTRAQRTIARRILLRLVSFGEGRSDTRRQQPRSALCASDDDATDFDVVVRRLVGDRLLAIDGDPGGDDARVDLAHEVMITAWPTLAEWIQTRRVDEQRRRQLEAAAALWRERGRGAGGLLDPVELAEVEVWRATASARDLGESPEVAALIAASKATHERLRRRRRAVRWSALGALSAFAIAVAGLAFLERRQAEQAKQSRIQAEDSHRRSQRLLALSYLEAGRQLVLDDRPLRALPYLVAARRAGEEGAPLRMLFGAATRQLWRAQLSHRGAVTCAAFSSDGARVVTASADNTARIWDASGAPLGPPLVHQSSVVGAAFSLDGARVVTASFDNAARVWDAATGKPLGPPLQHRYIVNSAAFSPDGARVVTASADSTARVWNAATGAPLGRPLEHQGPVSMAAFSPDGARVVTASADHTARVWDAATGRPLGRPLEHRAGVNSAAFSPDGTRIVTASTDDTARVWDAATGRSVSPPLEHQGNVNGAAFSPDGARVVTASADDTARVWDAATGRPLSPPLVHQDNVSGAAFSRDGARVVTASWDTTARVWDAATGKPLFSRLEHQGNVNGAAFSPDGARVVTASDDGTARVWSLTATESHDASAAPPALAGSANSPDGARVVITGDDHTARVRDAATGKPLSPPLEHQRPIASAAFSPDGGRVVTASADGTARIWDAATGKLLAPPLEHPRPVASAAFSPDGARVVTVTDDSAVRVWDAATGKPLTSPLEHSRPVASVAFSLDGMRVIAASRGGGARIWKLPLDGGSVAEWSAIEERSPYMLSDGVLVPRPARVSSPGR